MHTLSRPKVYALVDWYVSRCDRHSLVYRPSLTALLKRLGYPFAALLVGAGILYLVHHASTLTAVPLVLKSGAQVFVVLLGILSMLPVLSALIEEVGIGRDASGNLVVQKRSLWTSRLVSPLSQHTTIQVSACQSLARTRRHGPLYSRGYTWIVTVVSSPLMQGVGGFHLEFQLDHQHERPLDNRPFPSRVKEFVDALSGITGISADPKPAIVDAQVSGRGWGTTRNITIPISRVTRHEIPLDELPPDVRAKVESLVNSEKGGLTPGFTKEVTLKQEFKVLGKDGSVQHYDSIEDLPPEVREAIERMHRAHGRE
ncbi:MAG: hypothetical protein K1Y02_06330 [Candidatus Hydrogenedentes bacterium]|nr:hypothetical protein [Candidatus Hydrogenedentota bacterium]